MKGLMAVSLCVLLIFGATPARADFKYSDTSRITGGSLKSMMKTVGIFSKQASQAMKPVTTTRYIEGDRLRADNANGRIQIIDLSGRRIIEIDPQKKTYTEITFDEMKAALQRALSQHDHGWPTRDRRKYGWFRRLRDERKRVFFQQRHADQHVGCDG
jgi:hypothetical protein